MSDYTPTTEEVRESWSFKQNRILNNPVALAEFDRWLVGNNLKERATERNQIIEVLRSQLEDCCIDAKDENDGATSGCWYYLRAITLIKEMPE